VDLGRNPGKLRELKISLAEGVAGTLSDKRHIVDLMEKIAYHRMA
jgi:hypothetical protein